MEGNSAKFSIQDAMQLAKSPVGQQLLSLLQRSGGNQVQQAAALASEGNYAEAQAMLSGLLADPEVKALLQQLGG